MVAFFSSTSTPTLCELSTTTFSKSRRRWNIGPTRDTTSNQRAYVCTESQIHTMLFRPLVELQPLVILGHLEDISYDGITLRARREGNPSLAGVDDPNRRKG